MLKKLDIFRAPLPGFNIKGDQAVSSNIGGCVSVLIMIVTITFGLLKLEDLALRTNPTVSTFVQEDEFDQNDKYDSGRSDFVMAFALVRAKDDVPKNDPRFVKWMAKYR